MLISSVNEVPNCLNPAWSLEGTLYALVVVALVSGNLAGDSSLGSLMLEDDMEQTLDVSKMGVLPNSFVVAPSFARVARVVVLTGG